MTIADRADPNCSTCRGTGYVCDEQIIDGECWASFSDCICTDREWDDFCSKTFASANNGKIMSKVL